MEPRARVDVCKWRALKVASNFYRWAIHRVILRIRVMRETVFSFRARVSQSVRILLPKVSQRGRSAHCPAYQPSYLTLSLPASVGWVRQAKFLTDPELNSARA